MGRIVMNLNDQAICTGCYSGQSQWRYKLGMTSGMAWIGNDWVVSQFVQDRNGANIKGIARVFIIKRLESHPPRILF